MAIGEKRVYIILSIFALVLFSLMGYIKGGAFDFDETFSLAMIEHSFSEMWKITARDYHPPLSYFILKILSWVVKPFSEGSLELYRATSILGYFGTILLCIFPIRRLFGFNVSVIAILLFIFMPISFYIYSNFRMYAWATPFVLASFVYAFEALQSNTKWTWFKLTLFASAAMYTHYYSLISTFVIYIFLFGVILLSTQDKSRKSLLKNYLISGFALVVFYTPWLYFFASQLAVVKGDYWIDNPAASDIVFALQYYFVPKYYTEKYVNLLSNSWILILIPFLLISTIAIIALAYAKYRVKVRQLQLQIYVSIAAFSILIISLAIVMIYTFAVSPVYHIRYLMCYFGLFVLGFSICIAHLLNQKKVLNKALVGCFSILLLLDFGLCFYFNTVRSNFSFSNRVDVLSTNEFVVENYYCDEESFSDMAYLTVLHPQNNYFLVTDDNPLTRKATPPYIEGDTISGMPFYNFQKVKSLNVDNTFMYMTKENPQSDSAFSAKYQIVDSLYSGLYKVVPINK